MLGRTGKDKITGFVGVITGHARYISGCSQVLLSPKAGADGAAKDAQWFDEQRIEIDESVPAIVLNNADTPGCDRAAPKR